MWVLSVCKRWNWVGAVHSSGLQRHLALRVTDWQFDKYAREGYNWRNPDFIHTTLPPVVLPFQVAQTIEIQTQLTFDSERVT